jgi:hypothetical protein
LCQRALLQVFAKEETKKIPKIESSFARIKMQISRIDLRFGFIEVAILILDVFTLRPVCHSSDQR